MKIWKMNNLEKCFVRVVLHQQLGIYVDPLLRHASCGLSRMCVERASQVAGAKSTMASLWQVDDVLTCHLMETVLSQLL
ncbi:MAG: CHAT domain-containing protein [Planctomycetaceae bacterium]|nr:CHAT domain-containing protein [Planctomycetaceae bacterium]